MTVADESQRGLIDGGTVSVGDVLINETIPSGETWYVEALYLSSDGQGGSGFLRADIAAAASGAISAADSANRILDLARAGDAQVDPSTAEGATATVDAYATGGEVIKAIVANTNSTSGATFGWYIAIRRIL